MTSAGEMRIDAIISELARIVPEKYVSSSLFEGIKNCTVPLPLPVEEDILPFAVVMPGNAQEVSQILKFADKERIPVFVRGSGTSLIAHSRPHTRGIVINTHRMQALHIHEEYGYFECGPGITAAKVSEALAGINCFLPLWPGSLIVASMGGLVSNNTSGHIVDACLGKPGDYVLGLEVVLPCGDILQTGSKGLRRVAGTDLTKFFVGSDGIMGVITTIRMRLVPQFSQSYGMAVFQDPVALARGVKTLFTKRLPPPLFMEMMTADVAKIGYEIKGMKPPGGDVLMFSAMGDSEAGAAAKISKMIEIFQKEKALEVRQIKDMDTWHNLVSTREVIGSFLLQERDGIVNSAEVVSNLKQLEQAMEDAIHFNKGLPLLGRLQNYLFGHIGALSLHPSFVFPNAWSPEEKRTALKEIFMKEMDLNLKYDTCGGEWGQFGPRTPFFKNRYGNAGYGLVQNLKMMVDPHNILNPGILEGYR